MVDRLRDRLWRLPPATTGYSVAKDVDVPMRDGVVLQADHYAPDGIAKGTVLVRSPYGRTFPWSLEFGTNYATRGYHVVIQSVRGTFGSGGVFSPMVHEVDDGADTVCWLRDQPWFDGSFATVGLSYLGFVQWALLRDPPPELKAAVVIAGPHDFATATWGTGAFTLNDFLGWTEMMANIDEPSRLKGQLRRLRAPAAVARTADQLPLGQSARSLLGTGGQWFESWLEHPDLDDEFWSPMRNGDALTRLQVPVLLVGGWRDIFADQTLDQYRQLRNRGADVALTMGPWTHSQLMSRGAPVVAGETLAWLETHLGAQPRPARAVRIHVDRSGWVDLPHWPPNMAETVLYPAPHGLLVDVAPSDTATPSTFTYNPADPTPTVGGRLLSARSSARDDSELARRADVLSFTSAVLATDTYVVGNPVVELAHSSDNPHRDVFVRVSEVDAKGRSRNISDGFVRLPSHFTDGTVRIELDAMAYRFVAGARIRLLVAGGSHPRYARNLGTDESAIAGATLVPATHTVHHGAGGISRLVLPAGPRPPRP